MTSSHQRARAVCSHSVLNGSAARNSWRPPVNPATLHPGTVLHSLRRKFISAQRKWGADPGAETHCFFPKMERWIQGSGSSSTTPIQKLSWCLMVHTVCFPPEKPGISNVGLSPPLHLPPPEKTWVRPWIELLPVSPGEKSSFLIRKCEEARSQCR